MLKVHHFGDVIRFELARTLPIRWRYWTIAYRLGNVMIDSGCAHSASELLSALGLQPITCIVNTHTHEDHIGANGDLQSRYPDLKIYAHPQALPILLDPRKQRLQPYRRVFWGWPKPCRGLALSDGEIIEMEDFRLQVIYSPGHSPDHICLYEPDRGWLFTGDLFVGGKERALRVGYDIWQIIRSLKRIADLPANLLLPGSAQVRKNPQEEIRAKINYLEDLGGRILELHNKGLGVNDIVTEECGGAMMIEWLTLGHFTRRRLVLSFLSRNTGD